MNQIVKELIGSDSKLRVDAVMVDWYCEHAYKKRDKPSFYYTPEGVPNDKVSLVICESCGKNICLQYCAQVRVDDVENFVRGRVRILKRYCKKCL